VLHWKAEAGICHQVLEGALSRYNLTTMIKYEIHKMLQGNAWQGEKRLGHLPLQASNKGGEVQVTWHPYQVGTTVQENYIARIACFSAQRFGTDQNYQASWMAAVEPTGIQRGCKQAGILQGEIWAASCITDGNNDGEHCFEYKLFSQVHRSLPRSHKVLTLDASLT
jgi:hypothetical protein